MKHFLAFVSLLSIADSFKPRLGPFHISHKIQVNRFATPGADEGESLMHALLSLKDLAHETVVIKYGGHAMGRWWFKCDLCVYMCRVSLILIRQSWSACEFRKRCCVASGRFHPLCCGSWWWTNDRRLNILDITYHRGINFIVSFARSFEATRDPHKVCQWNASHRRSHSWSNAQFRVCLMESLESYLLSKSFFCRSQKWFSQDSLTREQCTKSV